MKTSPTKRFLMGVSIAVLAIHAAAQPTPTGTNGKDTSDKIQEPQIPIELKDAGTVYHTINGEQAQVTFTSKAPLQSIVGKSNAVVGYTIAGPADAPAKLAGAQWLLPVESLATGIPLRDDHLAHEWLHAKDFPTIAFKLTATEEITPIKSGDGFSTWSLTLVGDMRIRGHTRSIRVEGAKLSFLDASEKTAKIAPGDLCFLKCDYIIKLSDFGIEHPDVPDKVSNEITLTQLLRLSTVAQD